MSEQTEDYASYVQIGEELIHIEDIRDLVKEHDDMIDQLGLKKAEA